MPADEGYKLLSETPPPEDAYDQVVHPRAPSLFHRLSGWIVGAQCLIILILFAALLRHPLSLSQICSQYSQVLYSPAQEAIVYEAKKFTMGENRSASVYSSDPSDEVDNAWNDLYNDFGISQISKAEALDLPNKTVPLPADPSQYVIALANVLRKIIHRDYYADPITGDIGEIPQKDVAEHTGHCLNMLRQVIMCHADISPIVWHWSERDNEAMAVMNVAHSCRNWESIESWAKEHQLQHEFDRVVHVEEQD
ncbi:hypothetical protein EIP86_005319 [Pleurotus ostreatoroseus]|nr:hypothetical protein EIP86_005319 [Pleurotus ostreatoroseus]